MTTESSAEPNRLPPIAPITTAIGPAGPRAQEGPLLLLLHGFGSNERDLPGIVSRLGDGWDWCSVRAPYPVPTMGGSAWFPIGQYAELDRGAVDAAAAGLVEFVDERIEPGRPVVPVGFSQGGLMALELLRARPDRVPAAAVLSGFVDPAPHEGDEGLAARARRVFFGRGDRDDSMIPPEAFLITESWLREHSEATIRVYPGLGHAVSEEEIGDLADFLAGAVERG
ncbi:alpha/beta hydrolase [Gulosibacter sp. 10]|uniref:alpha/beta hydrolase n=1 Tax=Gulosibacter sp. 10 TaxID=1255570 RepID=UPI00097EAB98|nr:alpha/beta fold hydrolase [Gulosibacter sp. 10]SJM65351.1 possible phospholipase/carboxylesterase [Gulosibacter sp. 10]